eukprot:3726613-Amphidinium_carterae.1
MACNYYSLLVSHSRSIASVAVDIGVPAQHDQHLLGSVFQVARLVELLLWRRTSNVSVTELSLHELLTTSVVSDALLLIRICLEFLL